MIKPRNHVVLATIRGARKAGAHRKNNKALRRSDRVSLQKQYK